MRFIIANRLAKSGSRKESRQAADSLGITLKDNVDVLKDNKPDSEEKRRVFVVDADTKEFSKLAAEFDENMLVEPELPRYPAEATCPTVDQLVEAQGAIPGPPGLGQRLSYTVVGDGKGVVGARALVMMASVTGAGAGTRIETETDKDGTIEVEYDASRYLPALLAIEPANSYWTSLLPAPPSGSEIPLTALPKSGPDAWWRQLVGIYGYDENVGSGIKVGVVDTGLGPHPYLKHAKKLGAITAEGDKRTANATKDVRGHGTHVAGLIGARPVKGSGDFAGIAPGADLAAIRVFDAEGGAHQGDIAGGIDALALDFEADLINLSLGASEPSNIERDAIIAAAEQGALCIASAGNDRGAPISFPAGYPETIAVSALGIMGAAPPGTMAAASQPSNRLAFATQAPGLFVANFSNAGAGLICSAPGVGIISTVPQQPAVSAPYATKNGTSMASPIATAALATVLANDKTYGDLPRDETRPAHAAQMMIAMLRPTGLPKVLGGYGLSTGLSDLSFQSA